jgi:hypothetical protein
LIKPVLFVAFDFVGLCVVKRETRLPQQQSPNFPGGNDAIAEGVLIEHNLFCSYKEHGHRFVSC